MRSATRREAFTALGATALAGIVTGGFARPAAPEATGEPSADARLIHLCEQFDALEREDQALSGAYLCGSPEDEAEDAEHERLKDLQTPLLNEIVAYRATTPAGHRARARSLNLWLSVDLERNGADGGYWSDRFVWSIVRDLIGGV